MRRVAVPDGHEWLRVTDPAWQNPVDSSYSARSGGRWNPPGAWAALYCWPIATTAYESGLDGVWCRSAATLDGVGRELAWWPRERTPKWDGTRIPYGDWRSPVSRPPL